MRCATCGADLPVGAMFCGECGRAVHAQSGPVEQPTPDHEGDEPRAENDSETPSERASVSEPGRDGEGETRVVPVAVEAGEAFAAPDEPGRAEPEDAADVVDEATRFPVRQPAPPVRFVLYFSTGETVGVQGSGLIGRRPSAQPGEYFDEFVAIDDPGRSVSKTHLEYGQDGGVLWISDRFSANGTVVREPDRPARLCPGGMRSRVPRGSRVEIGEQFFIVG